MSDDRAELEAELPHCPECGSDLIRDVDGMESTSLCRECGEVFDTYWAWHEQTLDELKREIAASIVPFLDPILNGLIALIDWTKRVRK